MINNIADEGMMITGCQVLSADLKSFITATSPRNRRGLF